MTKLPELLKRLSADEEGTALIEYTILLGVVAVAAVTAAVAIGGWVGPKWTAFCASLTGATC
jgi:pilus assembly protein Flp/PilA